MSASPGVDGSASYAELAQQTKLLSQYRIYRAAAEKCRDEAIENIEDETRRIIIAEGRIRELVAEMGLA